MVLLDFMLLKAVAGAGSSARIAAARTIADDPGAPRRALVSMAHERAAPPLDYLGDILDQPPARLLASPDAHEQWHAQRVRAVSPNGLEDNNVMLVEQVPRADVRESIEQLELEERLFGYDRMPATARETWDAAFRSIAHDWLDAAAAEFASAKDLPQASGWGRQTVTYDTADGGLLLICAAEEHNDYTGVAGWFEAAYFVLGEVAEAAGFHEPSRIFDVD